MNLFKRIGSLFSKMSSRKTETEKLAVKVIQPEQKQIKVAPIRDIEDIVNGSKSPYFSPIQTRNQRIKTAQMKPIIPSLISNEIPQSRVEVDLTAKEKTKKSKKAIEMQELLDDLKKLPADANAPLEVLKNESSVVTPKPVKPKKKKAELAAPAELKPKRKSKSPSGKALLDDSSELPQQNVTSSPVVGKTKRKSKDSTQDTDVKLEKWEPNNWGEVLENIRTMRASVEAPVDTMGCHKCSDETADEKTQRFHKLVALMLSSQTKDQVTFEAMNRLKENSCTPAIIADMDAQKLETLLYPVSFYKNKAKYLKNTSRILIEQYDSDIPNNVKELIKLPGVGPKMAHICMSAAWDIVTGIGVDVHVHRISNRLGWMRKETKEPEQTRKELESWLPSDRWKEVNYLLVGFGQTVCTPTKPKCSECLNNTLCPSANLIKRGRPKKEKTV